KWLQENGNLAEREMHRTFNCGIGMIVVVDPQRAQEAQKLLHDGGEQVWRVGEIRKRPSDGLQIIVS
ncbi:MAG TPA: AIR synthase-related protein, partial [Burkholderiales bacterium]|nr:AIR synthase-related protein [Burkholderiales bacterium]